MAVTLTTNYADSELGHNQLVGESSYYYYYYAYYQDVSYTRKRIYFVLRTIGATREYGASISSSTKFNVSLSGYTVPSAQGSFRVNKNWANTLALTTYVDVDYNLSTGTWGPVSVSLSVAGGTGTYDNGQSMGSSSSTSTITAQIQLPDIDPAPIVSITGVAVQSGAYNSSAVASVSTLRVTTSYTKARTLAYSWTGAGQTVTGTIAISYATTAQTATFDIPCPANASNYSISITVTASNNTTSTDATSSKSVYGYTLPTYSSDTYTTRWSSNSTSGHADAQGTYGMLYLKWTIAPIDNTNSLQSCVVKMNGTTITAVAGSIADGYLQYIFALNLDTQGDLEITFTDRITSITITSLAVMKSIMPLSLYMDNTDVGVAIGAMATQQGFYIYNSNSLPIYLKAKTTATFYEVYIDANGILHIGSNAVAYGSGGTI